MAKSVQKAYWLDGEERCPHCLQRYAQAIERRCAQCDGAACWHCVAVVVSGVEAGTSSAREPREVICVSCQLETPEE